MVPTNDESDDHCARFFRWGERIIWPNVYLAPMAGATDLPFRRLVRELSGNRMGVTVSEFVSARAIVNSRKRELRGMRFAEEERPFCMQLFGGEPSTIAEAARIVEGLGVDFIEINAGCPVSKMVRKGGGAQLMRDLPRLRSVVKACREAISIPLSLKVRVGWSDQEKNFLESLKIAEGEGCALFVLHGRTREQGYDGSADWDSIALAKTNAAIPVIGNGDVKCVSEATMRLKSSRVDGIAIGRGALHNPWIFGQIADAWSGDKVVLPSVQQQVALYYRYNQLLEEDGATPQARLGRLKLIASRMFRAVQGGEALRLSLIRSERLDLFFDLLKKHLDAGEESLFDLELLSDLNV